MKSIVKFLGVTSCCLVGSVAVANAEPTVLADAELDRVAAGSCSGIPGCVDPPGGVFVPPGGGYVPPPGGGYGLFPINFGFIAPGERVYCAAIGCRPGEPGYPNPGSPVPVEPPGCEIGGCGPSGPSPTLEPFLPIEFSPRALVPPSLLTPIGFGGCGGPAGTCAYNPGGPG